VALPGCSNSSGPDEEETLGILAIVVHAVVSADDEVIEDTYDGYAQDTTGNVWCLGEDAKEHYACEAEDMAEVVGLNQSVTVPYGSFTGCLQTREFTPLEPEVNE
jgi:hypothetical protein